MRYGVRARLRVRALVNHGKRDEGRPALWPYYGLIQTRKFLHISRTPSIVKALYLVNIGDENGSVLMVVNKLCQMRRGIFQFDRDFL